MVTGSKVLRWCHLLRAEKFNARRILIIKNGSGLRKKIVELSVVRQSVQKNSFTITPERERNDDNILKWVILFEGVGT